MTPQDVIAKMAGAAMAAKVDCDFPTYAWEARISAALAEAERQGWVMVEEKQLAETVETLEDALNYMSEYFRAKWKYDDVAKAARAMLP